MYGRRIYGLCISAQLLETAALRRETRLAAPGKAAVHWLLDWTAACVCPRKKRLTLFADRYLQIFNENALRSMAWGLTDYHYNDVITGTMASQITGVSIVHLTVSSGASQRKQSFASLTFVRGIHRWPENSPHIGPITQIMFPFDDVIISQHWIR